LQRYLFRCYWGVLQHRDLIFRLTKPDLITTGIYLSAMLESAHHMLKRLEEKMKLKPARPFLIDTD